MTFSITKLILAASGAALALALARPVAAAEAAPGGVPACPTSRDAPDVPSLIQRIEQTLQAARRARR